MTEKLSVGNKNFKATFSVLDWHSRNWFRFKLKNFVFCFELDALKFLTFAVHNLDKK